VRILRTLALALLLSLLLSGCFLASTEPFYQRGKTIYDPALLGTWNMKGCSDNEASKEKYCAVTLTPYEQSKDGTTDKGYRIAFRDETGASSEFDAFLFELEGKRFLDTSVAEGPKVDIGFALHLVTTHILWKVEVAGGELTFTPFYRSLARRAAESRPPLATFNYEGDTILSAPTSEIQAWLAQHVMDPGAYDRPLVWKKGAPPAAGAPVKPAPKRKP